MYRETKGSGLWPAFLLPGIGWRSTASRENDGTHAMPYHLKRVQQPAEWRAMHDIRRAVLFAPGRHAIAYDENHPDNRAEGNMPFLFLDDNEPVGVVRLDVRGEIGIVRLVAIVADRQRQGLGRAMDAAVIAEARSRGISLLRVNAAADAVGFYEKTGWHKASWNPAELTGMARNAVQMEKPIGA
jgi:GNAT superfamily N-acetyltransferase